ncbi:hypothetical protein [Deinococcus sp. QL22]|uniref:hypothetical protein n=1 Tax=Deinococcus sp. QL22 TaxID=2939437 RepID=UPI002017D43B|nr:hypothetical protein [Deinococcus sp. QL22]UQN10378.1 hypothetical protein M1R55_29950 [Deinococcus sp. QL22]UQN10512.1 hypothetical protein M1R55_29275 [Deinococcus sp. QL22]
MTAATWMPTRPASAFPVFTDIDQAIDVTLGWHRQQRQLEILQEVKRRIELLNRIAHDPAMQAATIAACIRDPIAFINDWCWTYDPRNLAIGLPGNVPLVLRPRQVEFVLWCEARVEGRESGLIEKSRDEGATWVYVARAVRRWLWWDGWKVGIGSRKVDFVDKRGVLDSIFEKARFIIRFLPAFMLPKGFAESEHMPFMRIQNPANGATITGEGGDDIGRGGRSTEYLVDEHANIERPMLVENALSQNVETVFYLSTPRGRGNLFAQKRFGGRIKVFTFFWKDNPDKNFTAQLRVNDGSGERLVTIYPWYEGQKRRKDLKAVTMAQEIDIDYDASVEGILIPKQYVDAAFELDLPGNGQRSGGLDVSDGGADRSVYTGRDGPRVTRHEDVTGTAAHPVDTRVHDLALRDGLQHLHYDRLGVGASITATLVRRSLAGEVPYAVQGIANSERASETLYEDAPDTPAHQRFANYATELWWRLFLRFKASYEVLHNIAHHEPEDCISLTALRGTEEEQTLRQQLTQPTTRRIGQSDRLLIDKRGGDRNAPSPDHAESLMYAFAITPPAEPTKAVGSAGDFVGLMQTMNNLLKGR